MNIIIESEQRVGSRWIHYLLADLYGMRASPEIDGHHLVNNSENVLRRVSAYFREKRIVKFHHVPIEDIFEYVYPHNYKVITIGRNPRDRAISVAFHHIHDPGKAKWPQRGMTEEEAIRYTILEYDRYPISNKRMLFNMKLGSSTKAAEFSDRHIWTTYEWLRENPVKEIQMIAHFLGITAIKPIRAMVKKHSFKNKSGRNTGQEKRNDVWRRKGVIGDWVNWLTPDLVEATQDAYDNYVTRLLKEEDRDYV
jgi:hypothetical protein